MPGIIKLALRQTTGVRWTPNDFQYLDVPIYVREGESGVSVQGSMGETGEPTVAIDTPLLVIRSRIAKERTAEFRKQYIISTQCREVYTRTGIAMHAGQGCKVARPCDECYFWLLVRVKYVLLGFLWRALRMPYNNKYCSAHGHTTLRPRLIAIHEYSAIRGLYALVSKYTILLVKNLIL